MLNKFQINKSGSSWLWKLQKFAGVSVLAASALVFSACENEQVEANRLADPVDTPPEAVEADPPARDPVDTPPEAVETDPPAGVDPADTPTGALRPTIPAPAALIGRTDTASVAIKRMISPRVMIVQDPLWYGGLPVVAVRNDTTPALKEGQEIQVTGTFRKLVIASLEKEYDADLPSEVEVEFRARPYLNVNALDVIQPVTPAAGANPTQSNGTGSSMPMQGGTGSSTPTQSNQ